MITISKRAESKNKDHTVMTGGTISVDNVIKSSELVSPSVYFFSMSTDANRIQSDAFHQGIHSIEHSFAFSHETGSIRVQYTELSGESTDSIVDISPYVYAENNFGFRITSFGKLDINLLTQAVENGLTIMKKYLGDGNPVPFSSAAECGQYNFHSGIRAGEIIKEVLTQGISIVDITPPKLIKRDRWIVSDLRLLQPRIEGNNTQYCFPPLVSHVLSQHIEKGYNARYPDHYLQLGTFGCMTGAYLIADGTSDEVTRIHGQVKKIVEEIKKKAHPSKDKALLYAISIVLENIRRYGNLKE